MSAAPDPALEIGNGELPARRAGPEFFRRPTRTVARALLNCWLVRRHRGKLFGARLVEVEAYLGVDDPAAHTFGGRRTERVEPMWGRGGLLYVYFIYGMHHCANVVTRREGEAEAVLLRAASHPRAPERMLSGPGRLCRALGITRADSGRNLARGGPFEIRVPSRRPAAIVRRPRIGIDFAREARLWPLRYFLKGEPGVTFSRATR